MGRALNRWLRSGFYFLTRYWPAVCAIRKVPFTSLPPFPFCPVSLGTNTFRTGTVFYFMCAWHSSALIWIEDRRCCCHTNKNNKRCSYASCSSSTPEMTGFMLPSSIEGHSWHGNSVGWELITGLKALALYPDWPEVAYLWAFIL